MSYHCFGWYNIRRILHCIWNSQNGQNKQAERQFVTSHAVFKSSSFCKISNSNVRPDLRKFLYNRKWPDIYLVDNLFVKTEMTSIIIKVSFRLISKNDRGFW